MTLEFEKLSQEIERMGRTTSSRQAKREAQIATLKTKLQQVAVDWVEIERCVRLAQALADEKWFRAALPLSTDEPLDRGIVPPEPPSPSHADCHGWLADFARSSRAIFVLPY